MKTGGTFIDSNGDLKMGKYWLLLYEFIVVTIQTSSNKLTVMTLNSSLAVLFSQETNILYNGYHLFIDYDTSPLATQSWSTASIPCSNDNIIILLNDGLSKTIFVKFAADLSTYYWVYTFPSSVGKLACLAVDREINKIFVGLFLTTPMISLYKIKNEDGSIETARKITAIGSENYDPSISFYDGMLILVTGEDDIIFINKTNLHIIKQLTLTTSLLSPRIRFSNIIGNFMYIGGTSVENSKNNGFYLRSYMPYLNDIESTNINFTDSSIVLAESDQIIMPTEGTVTVRKS